jgi:hypothetical protein
MTKHISARSSTVSAEETGANRARRQTEAMAGPRGAFMVYVDDWVGSNQTLRGSDTEVLYVLKMASIPDRPSSLIGELITVSCRSDTVRRDDRHPDGVVEYHDGCQVIPNEEI